MKHRSVLFISSTMLAMAVILFSSCKTSQYGYAVNNESLDMKVQEKPDAINFRNLQKQQVLSLQERGTASRGLPDGLLGGALSLATNAVKKMIAKDREKYTASYSFALTDLYFYDQLSTESAFDPVGMQFNGFTLVRTFSNEAGQTDTAMIARFVLDNSRPSEIINNSVFRLKLQDIDLRYSKAKLTTGQKKTINMDIEISFNTSYVNEMGQLFDNIELGKFYFFLREAPLDKNDPQYTEYYNNLKNSPLTGRSFIVPRSFGYYLAENNTTQKSYSQGAYSINVNVTESTKDKFVTRVIVSNSDKLIDKLEGKVKQIVND